MVPTPSSYILLKLVLLSQKQLAITMFFGFNRKKVVSDMGSDMVK